jgi:putative ABC transport system substrate-binding protein
MSVIAAAHNHFRSLLESIPVVFCGSRLKAVFLQGSGFLVLSCMLSLVCGVQRIPARDVSTVAVTVSQKIRPYMDALEGLNTAFSDSHIKLEVFWLDGLDEKGLANLGGEMSRRSFDFFVAIGPDAVRFLWHRVAVDNTARVYTLILHPEKLLRNSREACGISLQIPVATQVGAIKCNMPAVHRLGILFNPSFNRDFFQKAAAIGETLGIQLIPLEIHSRKELPQVLKQHWQKLDGLWLIPDTTVISVSIVQYIIKHALLKKKPVIGYNRFFYESGAAMVFLLDYRNIGRQTGTMVLRKLNGHGCGRPSPFFEVHLNSRVMKKIGLASPAQPFTGEFR